LPHDVHLTEAGSGGGSIIYITWSDRIVLKRSTSGGTLLARSSLDYQWYTLSNLAQVGEDTIRAQGVGGFPGLADQVLVAYNCRVIIPVVGELVRPDQHAVT
jgi:hypothetical protein